MTPLLAQRLRTDRSFERLYRRHVADVYHYALAVCRNGADAEDVTQTTFMNAYRAVQAGEQPRAPKNWLLAIAHNVMRQRFRASARRPDEVELDDAVAGSVPDDEGYSAADIRRALGELAFNQRAALVMRELEGRSYAEIAEILGVSVGAIETLIFRARRALREQLEGSLTCHEAELAISRQVDGRLARSEKGALRAHLRTCKECATFARSQRAQRAALKGLAAVPLPASLGSFFGGGAAAGTAVAAKAAAVTAVGLLVTGGAVETARHDRARHVRTPAAAAAPAAKAAASNTAVVSAATERQALEHVAAPPQAKHGLSGAHGRAARTHRLHPVGRPAKHGAAAVAAAPAASHPAHPATRGAAAPGRTKSAAVHAAHQPSTPPAKHRAAPAKHASKPAQKAKAQPVHAPRPPAAPPGQAKPKEHAPAPPPAAASQDPPNGNENARGNGKGGKISDLVPIDLGVPLP